MSGEAYLLLLPYIELSSGEIWKMWSAEDEVMVRAAHGRYFQALGSGNMESLADLFVFPAVFKGFLEDAVIVTDQASLLATYGKLIAAAPKATRTELTSQDVSYLRPDVYMLTMDYKQYGANDSLIHEGRAVYFMKRVGDAFKLFAVF